MLGLPVREPYTAKSISEAAREREHFLINAAGDNTLRFVPPLIVDEEQIEDGLARLERVVEWVAGRN